jgi:hypothetical protein
MTKRTQMAVYTPLQLYTAWAASILRAGERDQGEGKDVSRLFKINRGRGFPKHQLKYQRKRK